MAGVSGGREEVGLGEGGFGAEGAEGVSGAADELDGLGFHWGESSGVWLSRRPCFAVSF
jgi:hypothetical protein